MDRVVRLMNKKEYYHSCARLLLGVKKDNAFMIYLEKRDTKCMHINPISFYLSD